MLLLLAVVTLGKASAGKPINVTYDQRALVIDGQRRMLISAGIHYPRATPEMWPSIIKHAKEGGCNVVQTYVFWNGHEPRQGQYNFEGRYDLVKFIKLVQKAGLFFHLRIGPYVCAEWNFGGFPYWLKEVPGIVFRTDNDPFKLFMQGFVSKIVHLMEENQLFAWQGGPIIMAQIENEYGNIEWEFGDGGKRYVRWAADLALSLDSRTPWIMCQQGDAPGKIINTCNGYYCDGWTPNSATKPIFWTEDWNGWFQNWGQATPHRPVEDNAFAVARFFQRGGSFQNYYMYFGGTNFARTAGGPFMTTTYDYDAPIDEYGLIRQPKWGHLKDLHAAIKLCEPALTSVDIVPRAISLGSNQEAHVYSGGGHCAAFLANIDSHASATVEFQNKSYVLPAWSVSILPDCKNVVFNSAQVGAQTALTRMRVTAPKPVGDIFMPTNKLLPDHISDGKVASGLKWKASVEPVGIRGAETIVSNSLLEQLNLTKDSSDYLWYSTSVTVADKDVTSLSEANSQANLVLDTMRDAVHIFVNGKLAGSARGWNVQVVQPINLKKGKNSIDLLSMTLGLQNYGAFLETWGAGIRGSASLTGLPSGDLDLSTASWSHQVGLRGEKVGLYETGTADGITWDSSSSFSNTSSLTWYKTTFDSPGGTDPVALDLGSMGKGQAWVNGHHLGRYWLLLAPSSGCSSCDYRGAYYSDKCRTDCGQPSQRWYHIPRAWLKATGNLLVLFEEIGGDVTNISLATRSAHAVCAHIDESQPPPVQSVTLSSSHSPIAEALLECAAGQHISHIKFASFGNPRGSCGHFHHGKCHATDSTEVVHKLCIGKRQCRVPVEWRTFGHSDPCPGITKSLAVQAHCSSYTSPHTLSEPGTPTYFNYHWQQPLETHENPSQRKPSLLPQSHWPM